MEPKRNESDANGWPKSDRKETMARKGETKKKRKRGDGTVNPILGNDAIWKQFAFQWVPNGTYGLAFGRK